MRNVVSTAIVKKATVEQLFIESGDIDSTEWAYAGQEASFNQSLENMNIIAQMKQLPILVLEQNGPENLAAFLKNKN